MKNKMKKAVSVLLTISMILTMTSYVFAQQPITDLGKAPNTTLNRITSNVLGYVQFFGYAIAVGMLLYIGIKYMMASANEKADLKKGSINYVIGAVIVAAAATIVGMFKEIGEGATVGVG